jgi:hypothetical protein
VELSDATSGVGGGFRSIVNRLKALAEHAAEVNQARRRLRRVDHLDGHLLRDIGLGPRNLRPEPADLRAVADRLMLMSDRRWDL